MGHMDRQTETWAASYGLDARLVMYVTGTYMTVSQQTERGDTQYTRK